VVCALSGLYDPDNAEFAFIGDSGQPQALRKLTVINS
jgi:hypothetical protein